MRLKRDHYRAYINTLYILISILILSAITIIYWLVDTQLYSLNIPIQPYIFFILIITILFGYKVGITASFISTLLIVYYLYNPRYTFNLSAHATNFIVTSISLGISVFVGDILRNYQRKLIFESDQLKALIKARDEFTSVAAHDLRTPLTVIKLYLQSMLKEDNKTTNKEAKKSLRYIDTETDKLIELINTLFDFSRIESNKMILNKEKCDIVTLCKATTQKISKIHPSHRFSITSRFSHLYIFADPLSLERVLVNIITNAVKYSPPDTLIRIVLTANKRFVTIAIKDQGKGIPQDLQDKLFDPFFQTDKRNFGLGLGLHIAKSLVTLHKGKIWYVSSLNKGTTFYLKFPLIHK